MNMKKTILLAALSLAVLSCNKRRTDPPTPEPTPPPTPVVTKVTVKNNFEPKAYFQSGKAESAVQADPTRSIPKGVLLPNSNATENSATIEFYANENSYLGFVTMYGWSADFFFAPDADTSNTTTLGLGIPLYENGTPRGATPLDVTSEIKLYDNGTSMDAISTNGGITTRTAESPLKNITEYTGSLLGTGTTVSSLIKAELSYDSATNKFKLTITNLSASSTSNATPLSPIFWAVLQKGATDAASSPALFKLNERSSAEITEVAEIGGSGGKMEARLNAQTGIYTGISPVLVVVYDKSVTKPLFTDGQNDAGKGLADIAEAGMEATLKTFLDGGGITGVKRTYVLVGTPRSPIFPGQEVSADISATSDDRIALVTMYGLSTDWFYGIQDFEPKKGSLNLTELYDCGTKKDEFPGATRERARREAETKAITKISLQKSQNGFTDIPDAKLSVTFE